MNEFSVPCGNCICCKHELNVAKGHGKAAPVPGDITICAHCNTLMQFGKKLRLERIPAGKLSKFKQEIAFWSEYASLQNLMDKLS